MAETTQTPETTTTADGKPLLAGKYETVEALEKGYAELLASTTASKAAEQATVDKPHLELAREVLKVGGKDALSPEQSALITKYGEADKALETKTDEKKGEEPKNYGTKPEHAGLPEGTDFATFDFLATKGMTPETV